MVHNELKVLLVAADPQDAWVTVKRLADATASFYVDCVNQIQTALSRLSLGDIDIVLLDPGRIDGKGLSNFERLHTQRPDVPIVVLTEYKNQELALRAICEGAHDFVDKGSVDGDLLARTFACQTKVSSLIS